MFSRDCTISGWHAHIRSALWMAVFCSVFFGLPAPSLSADTPANAAQAGHSENTGAAGTWSGNSDAPQEDLLDKILSNPTVNRVTELGLGLILGGVFLLILVAMTHSALFSASAAWCWLAYLLLIPLWFVLLFSITGRVVGPALTGLFIVGFPIARLLIPRSQWYKTRAQKRLERKQAAHRLPGQ